jgi:hypothetical protein
MPKAHGAAPIPLGPLQHDYRPHWPALKRLSDPSSRVLCAGFNAEPSPKAVSTGGSLVPYSMPEHVKAKRAERREGPLEVASPEPHKVPETKGAAPVVATGRHSHRARDRSSEGTTKDATRTTDEMPAKAKGAAPPCTVSACQTTAPARITGSRTPAVTTEKEVATGRRLAYSDSPAASRAWALSVKPSIRTISPFRKVKMVGSSRSISMPSLPRKTH